MNGWLRHVAPNALGLGLPLLWDAPAAMLLSAACLGVAAWLGAADIGRRSRTLDHRPGDPRAFAGGVAVGAVMAGAMSGALLWSVRGPSARVVRSACLLLLYLCLAALVTLVPTLLAVQGRMAMPWPIFVCSYLLGLGTLTGTALHVRAMLPHSTRLPRGRAV